jgi:hypothetical protein
MFPAGNSLKPWREAMTKAYTTPVSASKPTPGPAG